MYFNLNFKEMKTIYSLFIFLFLDSIAIWAQQPCGIYSTVSDFMARQISIPVNCQFGKKTIQISDFLVHPYVYIKTEQGKIKINKDSVYAIRNCNGDIYRICKQRAYLLLDSGKLQIYSYSYNSTVKIRTSKGTRFEDKRITDYYFTFDDTSRIAPLTVANVRLALVNEKIENEFMQTFPNDKTLLEKQDNRFIINCFFADKSNIH
jgi:hypothetical protein